MTDNNLNKGFERRVKRHVISQGHDFFAVVQPGFEGTAAAELEGMGLTVPVKAVDGGVEFRGRIADCFRTCVCSRTASGILMRIESFPSYDYRILERKLAGFPWELYLFRDSTLKFRCSAEKSMIYHTGKLEEIFSKALSARLEEHGADSPSGIPGREQFVHVRNVRDSAMVSLSASGPFLYKRGQRKYVSGAPLRETLAALILLEAGADKFDIIADPMCGSGTFSLEAAGILTHTPPAVNRDFPFTDWPCFRPAAFENMKKRLAETVISSSDLSAGFITSDTDSRAVEAAGENCRDFPELIKPVEGDFFDLQPGAFEGKKVLVVLNPPYGKRLEGGGAGFFRRLGEKLKGDLKDCAWAVIVPGHEKEESPDIPFDRKILFMNGGIPAAVLFRDI